MYGCTRVVPESVLVCERDVCVYSLCMATRYMCACASVRQCVGSCHYQGMRLLFVMFVAWVLYALVCRQQVWTAGLHKICLVRHLLVDVLKSVSDALLCAVRLSDKGMTV